MESPSIVVEIALEAEQNLGVTVSDKLIITGIEAGSPADGHLTVGDQVTHLNYLRIPDTNTLFFLLKNHCGGILRVTITRGMKSEQLDIPEERAKHLRRRPGFSYQLIRIDFVKGGKFGLAIKHHRNRVFVSRVDEGSLAGKSSVLQGDRIVDINAQPVSDKDVARTLLINSLQKHGYVTMIIERAVDAEASQNVAEDMEASHLQPPSMTLASDVRSILIRQQQKMEKKDDVKPPVQGIMKKPDDATQEAHVNIVDKDTKLMMIASDNETKVLRKVPKQLSPNPQQQN